MNNLATMKNCPWGGGGGVQGNLNWMPGYNGQDTGPNFGTVTYVR